LLPANNITAAPSTLPFQLPIVPDQPQICADETKPNPKSQIPLRWLVRSWFKACRTQVRSYLVRKLVCDQLRTSFEPASVMEFGFNVTLTLILTLTLLTLLTRHCNMIGRSVAAWSYWSGAIIYSSTEPLLLQTNITTEYSWRQEFFFLSSWESIMLFLLPTHFVGSR